MSILNAFTRPEVEFDPSNNEHIRAFESLCLGQLSNAGVLCRQHPQLRFKLEHPFNDVRTMLLHKVGRAYIKKVA